MLYSYNPKGVCSMQMNIEVEENIIKRDKLQEESGFYQSQRRTETESFACQSNLPGAGHHHTGWANFFSGYPS